MEPNNNNNNVENTVSESSPVVNTETKEAMPKQTNALTMPVAILIGSVLIALALILTGGSGSNKQDSGKIKVSDNIRKLEPITQKDHVRGDLNKAKVAVVEFSDLECPYCKQLHPIMQRMMEVYGQDVAWVYRHFPLESIHPNARPAAHASECVAELAGNDGFWKFIDGIFSFENGSPFEANNLATIVSNSGADISKFNTCQQDGKFNSVIDAYIDDAYGAGAQGTPDLTVVDLKTGEAVHIGADPNALASTLEQMLK